MSSESSELRSDSTASRCQLWDIQVLFWFFPSELHLECVKA